MKRSVFVMKNTILSLLIAVGLPLITYALRYYADAMRLSMSDIFYITLALGLSAIVIGLFTPYVIVGLGFIIGGLATLSIGHIGYWDRLDMVLKIAFASLVGFFIVLVIYRLAVLIARKS